MLKSSFQKISFPSTVCSSHLIICRITWQFMAFPHKYLFSQDTRCEWASRAAASPLRALRTRLHSGLERMGGTSPCAHQAPMPPPGTGQDAAPEAWQNRAPGTLLSSCTSSPARETRATQPGLILPLLCKY